MAARLKQQRVEWSMSKMSEQDERYEGGYVGRNLWR